LVPIVRRPGARARRFRRQRDGRPGRPAEHHARRARQARARAAQAAPPSRLPVGTETRARRCGSNRVGSAAEGGALPRIAIRPVRAAVAITTSPRQSRAASQPKSKSNRAAGGPGDRPSRRRGHGQRSAVAAHLLLRMEVIAAGLGRERSAPAAPCRSTPWYRANLRSRASSSRARAVRSGPWAGVSPRSRSP